MSFTESGQTNQLQLRGCDNLRGRPAGRNLHHCVWDGAGKSPPREPV